MNVSNKRAICDDWTFLAVSESLNGKTAEIIQFFLINYKSLLVKRKNNKKVHLNYHNLNIF